MYHSGTQVHLGDSRRVTATPARSSMSRQAGSSFSRFLLGTHKEVIETKNAYNDVRGLNLCFAPLNLW